MKKRLLSVILSVCLSLGAISALTGCGEKFSDDENTINIMLVLKGFGRTWLDNTAAAFETKYPQYKINVKTTVLDSELTDTLQSGASRNIYDLMFTTEAMDYMIAKDLSAIESRKLFEPLNSVYDAVLDGETKPVKDMLNVGMQSYYLQEDDNYYTVPWMEAVTGLIYNKKVLDDEFGAGQWSEPRTTNELIDLASSIEKRSAFVHSEVTSWNFCYNVWWAQYSGRERYNKFYSGYYYDETSGEYKFGTRIFNEEGRRQGLLVMEELMKYAHPDSNALDFSEAQGKFMAGEAAMVSNGDWLKNEMIKSYPNSDISFMKTPIISSLGTKLKLAGDSATDAQHESKLIEVIDYIDGGKTGTKPDVSDEAIEEIEAARKMVNLGTGHVAYIPRYANAKEPAKEFLKFLISKEGQKIFSQDPKGMTMPFGYDITEDTELYSSFSNFEKSKWEKLMPDAEYIFPDTKSKLMSLGGMKVFAPAEFMSVEFLLSTTDPNTKLTAQQIFQKSYEAYIGANSTAWTDLLSKAGLN